MSFWEPATAPDSSAHFLFLKQTIPALLSSTQWTATAKGGLIHRTKVENEFLTLCLALHGTLTEQIWVSCSSAEWEAPKKIAHTMCSCKELSRRCQAGLEAGFSICDLTFSWPQESDPSSVQVAWAAPKQPGCPKHPALQQGMFISLLHASEQWSRWATCCSQGISKVTNSAKTCLKNPFWYPQTGLVSMECHRITSPAWTSGSAARICLSLAGLLVPVINITP